MTWSSSLERERFWRDLVARFSQQLGAYVHTMRCAEDEAEEVVRDVWMLSVEREEAFVASGDHWPILQGLTAPSVPESHAPLAARA